MSGADYTIGVRDLRPGMRIEITQRPWTGTVTSIKELGGLFTALRDGDAHRTGEETSWSPSVIDRIRVLAADLPLPTAPGVRFWGSLPGCDPMWWFTTRGQADDECEPVTVWIGQDGTDVHEDDAEDVGLVRLPDPGDAPTTSGSATLAGDDMCPDCGCRVDRHEGTNSDPDMWCEQTAHAYVPCPSLAGQA